MREENGKYTKRHAKNAFIAPVRFIEQRGMLRVDVQRRLELRAPIHRQNVGLLPRLIVSALIDNYYGPAVLQAGRVVSVEVHFGKGDGVLQQGAKGLGVSQTQPLSDCERVREESFATCHSVRASGAGCWLQLGAGKGGGRDR